MNRIQKTTKAELATKCASTLKDQFLRLNYAVIAIQNIDEELQVKEALHESLIDNNNTGCIYDELRNSLWELVDFFVEFPECFDEEETEILNDIVEVSEEAGEYFTSDEADYITELQCSLYDYYAGNE